MREIEIKLRVANRPHIIRRMTELGWRARGKRELERNWVYDLPDGELRSAGQLLRVRESAGICLLTLKLPSEDAGRHKVKEEFEITASDCSVLRRILEELGYGVAWQYEKYRTYFECPGAAGEIVLDETPIGNFLELEGEPGWIDQAAADLGFSPGEYVTATYGALFEQYRTQNSGVGADMVFSGEAGQSELLGT